MLANKQLEFPSEYLSINGLPILISFDPTYSVLIAASYNNPQMNRKLESDRINQLKIPINSVLSMEFILFVSFKTALITQQGKVQMLETANLEKKIENRVCNQSRKIFQCCISLGRLRQTPNISQDLGEM